MRVAIFSDIHGNIIALDAVLEDIANSGPFDEHWILGDLVALGPCPVESDRSGYQIHFRRVDYDRTAVIDQLIQLRHPASEWIIRHFRE